MDIVFDEDQNENNQKVTVNTSKKIDPDKLNDMSFDDIIEYLESSELKVLFKKKFQLIEKQKRIVIRYEDLEIDSKNAHILKKQLNLMVQKCNKYKVLIDDSDVLGITLILEKKDKEQDIAEVDLEQSKTTTQDFDINESNHEPEGDDEPDYLETLLSNNDLTIEEIKIEKVVNINLDNIIENVRDKDLKEIFKVKFSKENRSKMTVIKLGDIEANSLDTSTFKPNFIYIVNKINQRELSFEEDDIMGFINIFIGTKAIEMQEQKIEEEKIEEQNNQSKNDGGIFETMGKTLFVLKNKVIEKSQNLDLKKEFGHKIEAASYGVKQLIGEDEIPITQENLDKLINANINIDESTIKAVIKGPYQSKIVDSLITLNNIGITIEITRYENNTKPLTKLSSRTIKIYKNLIEKDLINKYQPQNVLTVDTISKMNDFDITNLQKLKKIGLYVDYTDIKSIKALKSKTLDNLQYGISTGAIKKNTPVTIYTIKYTNTRAD